MPSPPYGPPPYARPRGPRGMTFIEVMVAVAIISIGVLAFMGAFGNMSKAIQKAKVRTLSAQPLTMEKIEILKQTTYHKLAVSTATALAAESGVGGFYYDTANYPEESITVGDITFIRRTLVEKMQEVGGVFTPASGTSADTGIKRVTVYTLWQEDREWKKFTASSHYANDDLTLLNSTLSGTVTKDGGGNLEGVQITPLQSTSFTDLTESNGNYSFLIMAGSYTLRASKQGYYTAYSSLLNVPSGSTVDQDFTLSVIGSGTVAGTVWFSTGLVISQVLVSSADAGRSSLEQEYIELYNPTTWTWTICDASSDAIVEVYYRNKSNSSLIEFDLNYTTGTVDPGEYFLIADTSPIHVAGSIVAADATYKNTMASYPNILVANSSAGFGLKMRSGGYIDRFGWHDTGEGNDPTDLFEGTGLSVPSGLFSTERVVRRTSTGTYHFDKGPAYDTDDNSRDLVYYINFAVQSPPRNSSTNHVNLVGRPGFGAVVTADDGLSSSTRAVTLSVSSAATANTNSGTLTYAQFSLPGVATGTWKVVVTTGIQTLEISTVAVTSGGTNRIPNTGTTPDSSPTGYDMARLTATIEGAFLTGTVQDPDLVKLSGIPISAAGATSLTGADGKYTLAVATSADITVEANPASHGSYNSNYVSVSSGGWPATSGQITTGIDFTLSKGGSIMGKVTNNGTDPLPNVIVLAKKNGVETGSAVTSATGYFTIVNLSTGDYWAVPQADLNESVSPSSTAVTLATAGETKWSSTFTLTGSPGAFTGTVKKSGVSIESGVLIVATTGTISSTPSPGLPPTNNSTLRSGGLLYYSTSSKSDGTYTIEVRGGAGTYNIYGYYSTIAANGAVTTTRTSGSGDVNGGSTTTVNLAF